MELWAWQNQRVSPLVIANACVYHPEVADPSWGHSEPVEMPVVLTRYVAPRPERNQYRPQMNSNMNQSQAGSWIWARQ